MLPHIRPVQKHFWPADVKVEYRHGVWQLQILLHGLVSYQVYSILHIVSEEKLAQTDQFIQYPAPQRIAKSMSPVVRGARALSFILAALLVLSLIVQVFLAGAGALVSPGYWPIHRGFAHAIELLPLLFLVVGLFGRLPLRLHGLNLLVFLLVALQYVFLYAMPGLGLPLLRALHAVNALVLFWTATYLWQSTWRSLRS
jgi:hypothetical protein